MTNNQKVPPNNLLLIKLEPSQLDLHNFKNKKLSHNAPVESINHISLKLIKKYLKIKINNLDKLLLNLLNPYLNIMTLIYVSVHSASVVDISVSFIHEDPISPK
jgi:hypothetical protein